MLSSLCAWILATPPSQFENITHLLGDRGGIADFFKHVLEHREISLLSPPSARRCSLSPPYPPPALERAFALSRVVN